MAKGGGSGGSVYNQSANALGQAGNIYGNANTLYGASAGGYTPSLGTAATAAMPSSIASGIPQYMNPYTDQVINRTSDDINRTVQQQQMQNNARASSMGAFGGSRAGIVEGLTNSEGQKNIGDIAAGLRQSGWNTAAGLSGQDITNKMNTGFFNAGNTQQMNLADMAAKNRASEFQRQQQLAAAQGMTGLGGSVADLGRTGFNIGQTIGGQQGAQGALVQQLMQQIMGLSGGQYNQFMQHPQDMLSMQLQALGMNPLTGATKTTGTTTPGIFDYLSLAAQTAGSIYEPK